MILYLNIINRTCILHKNSKMGNPKIANFVVTILVLICANTALIDLTQTNLYSNSSILQTYCHKDMQLDFFFNQSTILTCTDTPSSTCTLSNGQLSRLFFLNVNKQYIRVKLYHAQITSSDLVHGYNVSSSKYFVFYFADQYGNKVDIILPFTYNADTHLKHVLTIKNINDVTFDSHVLNDLQSMVTPTSGISLKAFNFMNIRDYSRFSQVANHNLTHTVLINEWTINMPYQFPAGTILPTTLLSISPDYAASGNKICYSSYISGSGLFYTQLRQNWPLWACFFVIGFFWAYYLIAPDQNRYVFDPQFQENKMTCWAFYSLHHLAYDQFFSRLSRQSLLLLTNAFQAVVLSAMYTTIGVSLKLHSDYSIIIWFAAVATFASMPIQYIMGGIFLRRIYNKTLQRYKLRYAYTQNLTHSKQMQVEYRSSDYTIECKLTLLYYWYYMIIFFAFVAFWAASIHMTLNMHLEYYYLQRIWLASLGICLILQNLVFDPILSLIFGHFRFYQIRGFYYHYEIGDLYKKGYLQK